MEPVCRHCNDYDGPDNGPVCAAGAAATTETTPASEAPGEGLPAMPEPVTVGTGRCSRDDECVLSQFICWPSSCGPCPDMLAYGITRHDLDAEMRACEFLSASKGPGPRATCEPCPMDPDPGGRQWRSVMCRDGRCVPATPGPSLGLVPSTSRP